MAAKKWKPVVEVMLVSSSSLEDVMEVAELIVKSSILSKHGQL